MILVVLMVFSFCYLELGITSRLVWASDAPSATSSRATSAMRQKAEEDLAMLRKNPEDFRTLITGVQIFLGRFGYGIGPFTGKLDKSTKEALTAYQTKTGLAVTGDINFETLQRLTEDDQVLNRIVPYLPPFQARNEEWNKWVDVKGSWMLKEGNTDDVLHTSRITCMQEFQRCIDSTATLVNGSAPQLQVHTHVYDIKEWDDNKIVSLPYDGEACAISILRISKNPLVVTRFVSLQSSPGPCSKVKPEDHQYVLDDGPTIYQALKVQKSKANQEILQVAQ
jgi:hypothetical protein